MKDRNRVTNIENKFMITRGDKGRWRNWEIVIDRYTLLFVKEITNENLQASAIRNHELSDVQHGFRKGRGTRDQIANI